MEINNGGACLGKSDFPTLHTIQRSLEQKVELRRGVTVAEERWSNPKAEGTFRIMTSHSLLYMGLLRSTSSLSTERQIDSDLGSIRLG